MQEKMHGTGSLVSSEETMMAAVLLSSLSESLNAEHLSRYERLCQAAEHVELVPHALPKEHMVRDFTQWFNNWLVQNEELIHRRERALAVYDEFTAVPIVMGAATVSDGRGRVSGGALVPMTDCLPNVR